MAGAHLQKCAAVRLFVEVTVQEATLLPRLRQPLLSRRAVQKGGHRATQILVNPGHMRNRSF